MSRPKSAAAVKDIERISPIFWVRNIDIVSTSAMAIIAISTHLYRVSCRCECDHVTVNRDDIINVCRQTKMAVAVDHSDRSRSLYNCHHGCIRPRLSAGRHHYDEDLTSQGLHTTTISTSPISAAPLAVTEARKNQPGR